MLRFGTLLCLFLATVVTVLATDYRLVVATDDHNVRQAPALVLYGANLRLSKEDRITSITFSAGEAIDANCVVSLDTTGASTQVALGPDIQVYGGKVLAAGARPTKKVIPASITVDVPAATGSEKGKLSSLVQPIIHQVYNLPWMYIGIGFGVILAAMFLMNRRSQAFTTSMSKEAKSLYLETVKSIVDRLEKIENSQHSLVKNPPVVRTFRAQIEGFEARLTRMEKQDKESGETLAKAAAEVQLGSERQAALLSKLESNRTELAQGHTLLARDIEAVKSHLDQFAKMQIAIKEDLAALPSIQAKADQLAERLAKMEAQLAEAEASVSQAEQQARAQSEHLRAEIAELRKSQLSLESMPSQLEAVGTSVSAIPAAIESVRASLPNLDAVEVKLDRLSSIEDKLGHFDVLDSKLDRLESIEESLTPLSDIKTNLEAMPERIDGLSMEIGRIHENILTQISGLTGSSAERHSELAELIAAHSFVPPAEPEQVVESDPPVLEVIDGEKDGDETVAVAEAKIAPENEAPQSDDEAENAQVIEVEPEVPEFTEYIHDEISAPDEDQSDLPEEVLEEAVAESQAPEVVILPAEPDIEQEASTDHEQESYWEAPESAETEDLAADEPSIEQQTLEDLDAVEPEPEPEGEATLETEVEPEPEPGTVQIVEIPEFHFANEVARLSNIPEPVAEEESNFVPTMTFHLDPLPDHLETFEDGEANSTLSVFHAPKDSSAEISDDAVSEVLQDLIANQTEPEISKVDDVEEVDAEPISMDAQSWEGLGASSAKTWSVHSPLPLDLVAFDNDLKPMTPIGTAPIGNEIGAVLYAGGRVIYTCGPTLHGFWPGKDDRSFGLDEPIALEAWRLATHGQNLFIAQRNRVRIVNTHGWYAMEQFAGEYVDQLVTPHQWIGVKDDGNALLEFRNHRGQLLGDPVRLGSPVEGLKLCGDAKHVFAGLSNGKILEVSENGLDEYASGPEGSRLLHLCLHQGRPLALFALQPGVLCIHFGGAEKMIELEIETIAIDPVLIGHKLYIADTVGGRLFTINLKKMSATSETCFQGVTALRRFIGIHHGSQSLLFALTCDNGKPVGRVVMIDPKSGEETKVCAAGQARADLIVADSHLVLATSCQYQNVIRVMEPFARQRMAA